MKDLLYTISTSSFFLATIVLTAAFLCTGLDMLIQGMLWGAGFTIMINGCACLFAAVLKEGFRKF